MMAEESTSWPLISKPVYMGGMGFNYKWNMCWLNDMLDYVRLEPVYRKWNHDKVTFSLMYAFAENFILPLPKRSLIEKMPGDNWQKLAGLRCFYGYWMAHPGKKLLFMGGEFAQGSEDLDWHLVEQNENHAQMQNYSRALNKFYRSNKALWQVDFDSNGFRWIDAGDNENSVVSFIRKASDATDYLIVISNFTPEVHHEYRIGVPETGAYVEVFNTDATEYGGSGVKNIGRLIANNSQSIQLTLPPLSTIYLKHEALKPQKINT